MRITVFGTGYVGLVQGAVLAEVGHDVLCVDVDAAKVEALRAGRIPIYEPGLEEIVKNNHGAGRLNFTTDAAEGVAHGVIQFIAVGTPPDEDGAADLSYVLAVAGTIAQAMTEPKVVVTKSTVPVGTADKVRARIVQTLAGRGSGLGFDVVSNPEFLKEGAAVADCMRPDRIIVGTSSPESEELLREVYAPFSRNHEKIIVMDVRSAELTKYAANSMLATKISFMNEMANLAERLGADIEMVRQGIGSDQRIGYQFIYPGAGYGGSCFPKDVKALIASAREVGFEPKLLQAVEDRNDAQKAVIFDKIRAHYGGDLDGADLRALGPRLQAQHRRHARGGEPGAAGGALGRGRPRPGLRPRGDGGGAAPLRRALRPPALRHQGGVPARRRRAGRDHRVAGVPRPDFDLVRDRLRAPVVFDGRNLYEPARMARRGFAYYAIGRGLTEPPAAAAGAAA